MNFENDVRKQYMGKSGKEYHDSIHSVPPQIYPWIARLRRDKIASFINENDVLLEYGVGTGWNIREIKCGSRKGYDLSKHLSEWLEENGIEFIEDLNTISDGSVNVVVCHHVLEHIITPAATLKEINRILCKNGKLLLFVPYEKGKQSRRYNPGDPNHHLYSWNVQTLGTIVEKTGFKVINGSVGRFGYDRISGVWAEKFHLGERGFRMIRRFLHAIRPNSEVRLMAVKK